MKYQVGTASRKSSYTYRRPYTYVPREGMQRDIYFSFSVAYADQKICKSTTGYHTYSVYQRQYVVPAPLHV